MRQRTLQAILSLLLLISGAAVQAQNDGELKVKFRSRALIDATLSSYGKEDIQGYYHLEDFRVGFKATYNQYELKADIGLGGGKVAIKDLLFNYHLKNSVIAIGNAYEPFSMDMLISTADMRLHQSAASVLAFTDSRKLGITYHYYSPHWYAATGLYTHNDINKIGENQKNTFVSTSRIVWRNIPKKHRLLHVGGAFSYRTKEVNTTTPPVGSVSSAGITSMFPFPMLEAEVSHMGTEVKGLVEALYTTPRLLIQTEYFLRRMNRTEGEHFYRSHGGYIQGSYLIKGKGFEYDAMYGIPGRPSSEQAIELVLRLNYTNLNHRSAHILGGEETDLSCGVNFYLNRYLGIKLNGSYVWTGSHCNAFYQKNIFLMQARMQYIF